MKLVFTFTDLLREVKLIFPILFLLYSCTTSFEDIVHSIDGKTMGTTFNVKFISDVPINIDEIQVEINAVLKKVNQQMSTYIPNSELSLFNKSTDTNWINVSDDLALVFNSAINLSRISDGSFDITIGPLVNLWGFGPENKPNKIPSNTDIEINKKNIGFKNISVRLSPPAIKKTNPKIYCDLSAIAKGFGVDKVSEYLFSIGIENHLVEIGGELRANGKKNDEIWKVGISSPNQDITIQEIIELDNMSMATSGDYWNYFEENGIRYSHTIDPISGKPITHKLASVTVVGKTCMETDALATAIDVMGPEAGLKFAEENELKVYFIVKGKNNFEVFSTPQFENLIKKGK